MKRLFNNLSKMATYGNHTSFFGACAQYSIVYVHLFAYHIMHRHVCLWHQVLVINTSTSLQPESSIHCYKHPQKHESSKYHSMYLIVVTHHQPSTIHKPAILDLSEPRNPYGNKVDLSCHVAFLCAWRGWRSQCVISSGKTQWFHGKKTCVMPPWPRILSKLDIGICQRLRL